MKNTHVNQAVSSSLRTNQRSSPASALSSQDTLPLVLIALVCSKQPSDLATRHSDISSWDVGVGADVAGQLAHEGHTELADLVVGLALGVEVGTTFATTDVDFIWGKWLASGAFREGFEI
jgi:hypothetical protein